MVDLQSHARFDTRIERLTRRFRCKNCGTKNATFVFDVPEQNYKLLDQYKVK